MAEESSSNATATTLQEEGDKRLTGRVKWFNNRAGFGFLTVLDGANKGKDVFVHHSNINVSSEQYKYLVEGEYVNFTLSKSDNKDHPFQAADIKGVWDGPLMCETRYESRARSGEMGGRSFKKRQPSRVRGGVRD
tara:strand:- start:809 stop:1213 length:405 start_codon:yes stop_codon:yes gene_type:complete